MANEKVGDSDSAQSQTGPEKVERRHIARLKIRDVLAIESLDLEVSEGGLEISGRTGSGKTSILDGISAAFGRSARAEMLRQGTERGELLVVLDDGSQISREVTPKGLGKPVVLDPLGQPIKRPADYLSKIMPGIGLNPVEFLDASDDRRVKMLADAFPIKVSLDRLQELAGPDVDLSALKSKEAEMSGLELAIEATRLVNAKLREQNALLKRADAQCEAVKAQVPPGFNPEDIRNVSTADLANELARITQHNRVVTETHGKLARVEQNLAKGMSQIEQTKAEIDRLQQQLKGFERRAEELEVERSGLKTWLAGNPTSETTKLEMRLQSLDEQRVILGHFDRGRELEVEVNALKEAADSLKFAKGRLEALPADLTRKANIPIDGLTIEDDAIRINGLPVDNISDGERLRLAIQIAAAGAGDLGFVCVDGAERLSDDVREELLNGLESRGIQFFLTAVRNEDLTIKPRLQVSPPEVRQEVHASREKVALADERKAPELVESRPAEAPKAASVATHETDWQKDEAVVPVDDEGLGVFADGPRKSDAMDWAAYHDKVKAEEALQAQEDVPDFDQPSPAKPETEDSSSFAIDDVDFDFA